MHDLAEIADVLHDDRVAQAHVLGGLLDHRVRGDRPQDHARRVARDQAQQREDRERDQEDDDRALREAAGEEGEDEIP